MNSNNSSDDDVVVVAVDDATNTTNSCCQKNVSSEIHNNSDQMYKLKLSNIFTYSERIPFTEEELEAEKMKFNGKTTQINEKTAYKYKQDLCSSKKYSFEESDYIVEGTIKTHVLEQIIELNMHMIHNLIDFDIGAYGSISINNKITGVLHKFLDQIKSLDSEIFNCKIYPAMARILPAYCNLIEEKEIVNNFKMYKEGMPVETNKKLSDDIKKLYREKNYNALVNRLLLVNRFVYPSFMAGMLLCVISEMYIIFMDIKSKEKQEDIVLHIFCSYMQKVIYSNHGYELSLQEYFAATGKEDGQQQCGSSIERKITKVLSGITEFKNKFAMTSDALNKVYDEEQILRNFMKWETMSSVERNRLIKTISKHFARSSKLNFNSDQESEMFIYELIPYVLSFNNRRIDRVKNYIHNKVKTKSLFNRELCKHIPKSLIAEFENIFEHLLFPNAVDQPDNVILNLNEFGSGTYSFKRILFEAIQDVDYNKLYSIFNQCVTMSDEFLKR